MPQPPDPTLGATPDTSEVEWQLDADDLDAIERWLAAPGPRAGLTSRSAGRKQIVDHYVDTSDLRLHAAGYAVRLRGANGKSEVTLKSIVSEGDADAGLRRRLELNEPIRYALLHCLSSARGPAATRIRQHAAVRDLRVLFTVRTDRRIAMVADADGMDLGEVALDDTTIEAGDHAGTLRRVEVEALAPGAEIALAPFVELLRSTHGLQPGTSSKFGGGLALAREAGLVEVESLPLPPPTTQEVDDGAALPPPIRAVNVPSAAVSPEAPVASAPPPPGSLAALVSGVLSTQLAQVQANEAGTRLGEDIEALHDMRVAVRRLRTALRLFARMLPSTLGSDDARVSKSEVDASLRWLAAELGGVRDLDVQLERIEEWRETLDDEDASALEPLAELLRKRRQAARLAMIAAMDTPRLAELYRWVEALAAAGGDALPQRALEPAVTVMPEIVGRQYRAFRKRARRIGHDEAGAALLHETRIRAKRLRYAVEFAEPLYGKRARVLVSALKRAQDVLGLHQDAEVAIAELRSLALEAGAELPPATLFAMGEVAQRYRESQDTQRAAIPEVVRDVQQRWRRLRAGMRARRDDA